jgi:hypothetical protein
MEMTDKAKMEMCLAKIERSFTPPFDFKLTEVFNEDNNYNFPEATLDEITLEEGEELICSTFVDEQTWTLLTTRRILSADGLSLDEHSIEGITKSNFGDYKDSVKQAHTRGFLFFKDGNIVPIFIETGRASAIMVTGITTISKSNGDSQTPDAPKRRRRRTIE